MMNLLHTENVAFAACLLGGLVCMFLSMIVFFRPIKFAILFTFGSLLAVGSWEIHSKILIILAIICEICALFWYSLSYIPFARRMISELMIRFCDTEL